MINYQRIPRKQCSEAGCKNPVFSHGKCQYHARWGQKKAIRSKSDKQRVRDDRYRQECQRVDRQYTRNGYVHCFFCDTPIYGLIHHHHVAGRTGELMFKGIIPSHPQCHSAQFSGGFHGLTPAQMVVKPWIGRYLALLRDVDQSKYFVLYHKLKEHGYENNAT